MNQVFYKSRRLFEILDVLDAKSSQEAYCGELCEILHCEFMKLAYQKVAICGPDESTCKNLFMETLLQAEKELRSYLQIFCGTLEDNEAAQVANDILLLRKRITAIDSLKKELSYWKLRDYPMRYHLFVEKRRLLNSSFSLQKVGLFFFHLYKDKTNGKGTALSFERMLVTYSRKRVKKANSAVRLNPA